MLAGLSEVRELDLVLHVLDLLLSGIVAHGAHQVRQLIQGHCPVETTRLGRVLVLAADHRIVEEIFHVLVGLAIAATFDQVDERLDAFTAQGDCLVNRRHINRPHVNGQVLTTTSEQILAIRRSADIFHDVGVRDQAHGLVRVAIQRHLDEADDLLFRSVYKELVGVVFDVELLQLDDLPAIGWSQACAPGVFGADVPDLHLVVIIGSEKQVFLSVDLRVPNACGRVSLFLDFETCHNLETLLLRRGVHIVLEDTAVTPDGEQTQLSLLVLVQALPESNRGNLNLMCAALPVELPLNGLGGVALQVILLEQADALIRVHGREILASSAIIGNYKT